MIKKLMLTIGVAGLACQLLAAVGEAQNNPPLKSLKILAIGNSFSEDGLRYVYQIAKDAGVEKVVLGNLYVGGCSLATHWANAKTNAPKYNYQKNTDGTWTSRMNSTMEYGIQDENWDMISIQQVSSLSGLPATYNSDLDNLIVYVNSKKTNPDATLVWHMTWAYQANSTHSGFATYDKNQMTMYQAIVSTVSNRIAGDSVFSGIIPSGTAIQNMRTSYIGDTLTRDGYHMSLNLGRYIASMTWVKALTGASIDNVSWVPNAREIPETLLPVIKEAVNNAVQNPFSVTQSSYTNRPTPPVLHSEISK
jgi:hypothetical protein